MFYFDFCLFLKLLHNGTLGLIAQEEGAWSLFYFDFCLFLKVFHNGTLGFIAQEDLVLLIATYLFRPESIAPYLKTEACCNSHAYWLDPNLLGKHDLVSLVLRASIESRKIASV